MIAAKNRGRPPLFGKAMTPAQRKKRHLAKRNADLRANAPALDPVLSQFCMTSEELAERLGGLQIMTEAEFEAWKAIPGAIDPADYDL